MVDIYFIEHEILRGRSESIVREARTILDNNVIPLFDTCLMFQMKLVDVAVHKITLKTLQQKIQHRRGVF